MILDLFKKHKVVFLYVFVAWIIFYISIIFISDLEFRFPPSLSLNSLGLFGDSFNILTSLFTGLAFAGVIVSVILQTQELKETREEFKGQKEALELQQKEMVNQSFDNKFFKMLDLLNSIIEYLTYEHHNVPVVRPNGIPEFQTYTSEKKRVFTDLKKQLEKKMGHVTSKDFFQVFKKFNDTYDSNFKYYFINFYQILKYIDNQYADDFNKAKAYTNILRAQLPKDALVLLFYNGIGVTGFTDDKYKILLERYAFFEHLRFDDLNSDKYSVVKFLLKSYELNAFGNNENMRTMITQIHP